MVLGVNRKRVQRLMRLMGIEAIYPKRRTTWPGAGHKIYPYLLRNVEVTRPDQVWASDITYVPLRHGFLYLVAVMDWYSRYVLAWRLSNTLDGQLLPGGARRSAVAWPAGDLQQRSREPVHGRGVHVAAGGARRGDQHGWPRPSDRQRVHRAAVAEREVRGGVPADYADGWEAEASLAAYFRFYNEERIHQALGYRTPAEVYRDRGSSGGQPPDEKRIEIARNKLIAG